MADWWEETLHDGLRIRLRVDKLLHDSESAYQHLMLFENEALGRVLTVDGIVQTTERDEFIYHEMLSHTPILAHVAARRILIIGGGDGGMLRRVLMHPGVERAVVVEIDESVIELSKRYLPSICGAAFEDNRAEVIIGDGARFVAEGDGQFDVIIVDSPDPVGPAGVLFERGFYSDCKSCLAVGGVIVTQNGVPFLQGQELRSTMHHLRSLFADATCYLAPVPIYIGGFMAFGWASDDPKLRRVTAKTLAKRAAKVDLATRYYTPVIHEAAFALPAYVEALVAPA